MEYNGIYGCNKFQGSFAKKTLGILDLVYSYKYLFLLDLFYVKLSDQIEFLSQFNPPLRLMWSLDHHHQQFGCLWVVVVVAESRLH